MSCNKSVCLIAAAFTLMFFLLPHHVTCGEEGVTPKYMVIRLLSEGIDPPSATINQGTVIIWVNEAPETVEIQFANNEMATSCNGSPLYNPQTKQAILSQIAFGGLESICLVQKGEFNYTVKRGSQIVMGKICVK